MAEPVTGPADIIIVNATILPMGGRAAIQNGMLKISDNSITELGPANRLDLPTGKKRIDARGGVVMPGFINCHTHIASNMLLRGLLEDMQLFEWLSTMWRLKRNFDEETLYWASLMDLVEMARSGITCFNEHFDAYRVEPQVEALKLQSRSSLGDRARHQIQSFFAAAPAKRSGVHHQKLRIQSQASFQLSAKSFHRLAVKLRSHAGQVDQVSGVNHQRRESVLFAQVVHA